MEENGGELSDEQNYDSFQNTKYISQVSAHADGNEFESSSLTQSTQTTRKKKKKNKLKRTEKSNCQEIIDTEEMNVL